MRVNVDNLGMLRAGRAVRVNVVIVPSMGPGPPNPANYSRFTVGGQFCLPVFISRLMTERCHLWALGRYLSLTRFTVGRWFVRLQFSLS